MTIQFKLYHKTLENKRRFVKLNIKKTPFVRYALTKGVFADYLFILPDPCTF